jgi:hypothetical protein
MKTTISISTTVQFFSPHLKGHYGVLDSEVEGELLGLIEEEDLLSAL